MEIISSILDRSLFKPDWVRLTASVKFDNKSMYPHTYWLEVEDKYASDLTTAGDPWVVHLITLAMTLGEPLRTTLPVDRVLVGNLKQAMKIWKRWYPYLIIVPIEADFVDLPRPTTHVEPLHFIQVALIRPIQLSATICKCLELTAKLLTIC